MPEGQPQDCQLAAVTACATAAALRAAPSKARVGRPQAAEAPAVATVSAVWPAAVLARPALQSTRLCTASLRAAAEVHAQRCTPASHFEQKKSHQNPTAVTKSTAKAVS